MAIDQLSREQQIRDNPYMGLSDEELDRQIAAVRKKIAVGSGQGAKQKISDALGVMGDIYLQKGGLKSPPRVNPDNSLNDWIMKERIKAELRQKPEAEIPQGETPPGLWRDQATGKVYKVPIEPVNEPVAGETPTETPVEKQIPTGAVPEGMWRDPATGRIYKTATQPTKVSAAAEKRAVEEQKLSDELGGLLNSFERAANEARQNVKGFGARGLEGRGAGIWAEISGKAGYLPATNVYNAQRKAFATVVAKAAGEIRPTDEDIRRFVATLPDTGKSDEENDLLISDINEKVAKGGLANLWFSKKNLTPTNVVGGQERSSLTERDQAKQVLLNKGYSEQEAEQMLGQ